MDEASLDVLGERGVLGIEQRRRGLWRCTVRSEELAPGWQLGAELANLGRDLPVSQVVLQALSQAETCQLLETIVGEGAQRTWSEERRQHGPARPAPAAPGASPAQLSETPLSALGNFLFAHTDGQPLYLLETLKLLRERQWLVPRLGADGVFRLALVVDIAEAVAQEQSRRELLPPSVRAMIQARLAKLQPPARQLVRASAVLGTQVSAQLLWQVAAEAGQAGLAGPGEAGPSGLPREG